LVILLVLALGYLLWPYQTVQKYSRAVEAKDTVTMLAMTDREALRKSITDLAVESAVIREIEVRGRKVDEGSLRAEARRRLELPAAQQQIDADLDAERIRARLAARPKLSLGSTIWTDDRWHSLWEFSVGDQQGGRLIFRFNGLGWRHCGFEFTKAELRQRVFSESKR